MRSVEEREKKIREEFSNRMHGYAASLEDVQEIIDVIETLTNKNISIKRAQAILNDAARILELITIV